MNGMNGWWVGLLLAACLVVTGTGWAEDLCVESLCLSPPAGWRRGPAEREEVDGVYQLDLGVDKTSAVQVLLIRRAPVVRGTAEAYYDRLTRYWRGLYGKAVSIDWFDAAGVRWRYVRRPSADQGRDAFQFATVADGRAYSLLGYAPGESAALPGALGTLLEHIRFGAGLPAAEAVGDLP